MSELSTTRLTVIIGSMYFGVFLGALDGTVVASLLSDIASDLKELSRVAWIATGYLVACAAFQPLYGKISDIYGRKEVLIFCNVAFGLGCAICGFAKNLEMLVLGRVVSGIGGGGIMSVSTIATNDLVPLRKRGVLQGVGNLCFGAGAGIGGVFGGYVSDRWGWRAAFKCQVPVIILSGLCIVVFFKPMKKKDGETQPLLNETNSAVETLEGPKNSSFSRVDIWGSLSLVTTLMLLMLAISTGGRQIPWTHPLIPVLLVSSLIFAGIFVYVELYVAREPVIPVRLFSNRTILASSLTNFFTTMTVYSILFFVPILLSSVNGMDSTQVGQRLVGNFVGVAIGSFFAGVYMKRTGRYYKLAVVSPFLLILGNIIALRFDQYTPGWVQYVALILCGFGYAAMLTVTLIALVAAVPHEFQAVTTSIQYAFRGVGSTLGVSLASAVFQNQLVGQLNERIDLSAPGAQDAIDRVLDSVQAIRKVPERFQEAIIESYLISSRGVLIFALGSAVFGFVCSVLMKEYKLSNTLNRD